MTVNSENRDGNVNSAGVSANLKMPVDNDGVWGYVYYSYSVKEKKATCFLKHVTEDTFQIYTFNNAAHPPTK